MQCERAQEFFSDYLERTLDRPMTVALEAHLAACGACREDVEALQVTLVTLDCVPEVEPPADGAWQVMARLRDLRAEQWEAQRTQAPTFLEWLRSLRPARVAMGTGLGTLVVAGALLFVASPAHTRWTLFPWMGSRITPASVTGAEGTPPVLVFYEPLTEEGQQIVLQLAPEGEVTNPHVEVSPKSMTPVAWQVQGTLGPQRSMRFPLTLPSGLDATSMWVTVRAPSSGRQYRYLVVTPLGERRVQPVTLVQYDQPVEDALLRLAPSLGRPVVVDESLAAAPVSLQVDGGEPDHALENLAGQARARVVRNEPGLYRLVPQP